VQRVERRRLAAQPGTSWQWQLTGSIDTSVDVAMYDIDLSRRRRCDRRASHQGKIVICYSARAAGKLSPGRGRVLAGRLETRSTAGPTKLARRAQRQRQKHHEHVSIWPSATVRRRRPDNVDGYANDSASADRGDQLDFNRFLAKAHARRLSVGLKNTLELVPDLEPDFDWA
jgi:hypothetical protein